MGALSMFSQSTQLLMADGSTRLAEALHIGDLLQTSTGMARITNIFTGMEETLYRLVAGERCLVVSEGQPIWNGHGFIPASKIKPGIALQGSNGWTAFDLQVTQCKAIPYNEKVYGFQLEPSEHGILYADGIPVGDFDCEISQAAP